MGSAGMNFHSKRMRCLIVLALIKCAASSVIDSANHKCVPKGGNCNARECCEGFECAFPGVCEEKGCTGPGKKCETTSECCQFDSGKEGRHRGHSCKNSGCGKTCQAFREDCIMPQKQCHPEHDKCCNGHDKCVKESGSNIYFCTPEVTVPCVQPMHC